MEYCLNNKEKIKQRLNNRKKYYLKKKEKFKSITKNVNNGV
jgi:hypothetical protein